MIQLIFECDGPGCSRTYATPLDAHGLESLGQVMTPPRWVCRRVFETCLAVSEVTYEDRRFCYCEQCALLEESLPVKIAPKVEKALAQTVIAGGAEAPALS